MAQKRASVLAANLATLDSVELTDTDAVAMGDALRGFGGRGVDDRIFLADDAAEIPTSGEDIVVGDVAADGAANDNTAGITAAGGDSPAAVKADAAGGDGVAATNAGSASSALPASGPSASSAAAGSGQGTAVSAGAPPPSGGAAAPSGPADEKSTSITASYRSLRAATSPMSARLVVRRSPIHGWGLFLKQDMPRHSVVIEYSGELVREGSADRREVWYEDRHRLLGLTNTTDAADAAATLAVDPGALVPATESSPSAVDLLSIVGSPAGGRRSDGSGSCYLFRVDDEWIVDATLKGSAARFMNHCCEPNCYSEVINVDGEKKIVILALRDLKRGEEVTYNYKFAIETDASLKVPCYCGSANCPGSMN